MTHYHVLSTRGLRSVIASVIFDTYEESLLVYTQLSTEFFQRLHGAEELSIDNARLATENGKAAGAFVGTHDLAFVWMRCDERCASGTWN